MNGLILCTYECNMRCKYCFEERMHDHCSESLQFIRGEFSYFVDTYLDSFVTQLIDINNEMERPDTNITIHGGEPLLVGKELLEKAFKIIKSYSDTRISLQTNGTLVTDEIADLLAEYDVSVGVSLDGPKEMHDAYRRMESGAETFDLVMSNISKMKSRGVKVGALATVTDLSVKRPEEFYRFFADLNLHFSFNPCFTDPALPSSYKVLNMGEYITFYKKMYDIWINDETNNLSISCFERIMSAMGVKKRPYMEVCSYIPDCSNTTVAVNTNGDIYRCLHYCNDKKNKIGNLSVDPLRIAVGDCNVSKRWEYLKNHQCKDCDIQEFCYGGCPYVAESINGTINSCSDTCMSQKAIVHHIHDHLLQFTKTGNNG